MREILTEIVIDASLERVWEVLIDTARWGEWNPFIPRIEGELSVGSRLVVRIEPPGGRPMTFKSIVSCMQENRDFAWVGSLPLGAFRGEHIFEVRPSENSGTRLIHREEFSGWLLPILWKKLDKDARAGFELMNEALKNEAERTR